MKNAIVRQGNTKKIAAVFVAAILVLVVIFSVEVQASDEKPQSTVVLEVKSFMKMYLEVIDGKDEAAIRKLYVPDSRFSWFTDGQRLYPSVDDVVKGFTDIHDSGMALKTNISDLVVIPLGDHYAHVLADFNTKATMGEREIFDFSGVLTILVERSKSGDWQILQGHSSTPGGPPG